METLSTLRDVRDMLFRLSYRRKIIEREGIRLIVDHPAISDRMYYVLCRGFEADEVGRATRHLASTDRVLEVGAGVGFTALCAIRRAGIDQYAVVEANPDIHKLLLENLRLNGHSIPAVHAAVSAQTGPQTFYATRDFWSSSIYQTRGQSRTVTVPGMRLWDIVSNLPFRPSALVMDIEGGEANVADEEWDLFQKILVEFHGRIIGADRRTRLKSRLLELGFKNPEYGVYRRA